MDGNGRWATQRGLSRTEGHKMGEAVVIDIVCGAIEIGIKWLSLYAFSTENWKRSAEEVRFLMGFNRDVVRRRRENLKAMGVRIRWVGSRPRLWRSVINELAIAEAMTAGQRRHHGQLLRQLRWSHRNRRSRKGYRARGGRGKAQPGPCHRGHHLPAPAPARHPRRGSLPADLGGAAVQQFHAVAGRLRRIHLSGQVVARL